MSWKRRAEYKTLAENHRPILVRSIDPNRGTGPMVVIWSDHGPMAGGHFYPCPGIPIFFGTRQFGMMVHDSFDEWMEIPD